MITHVQGELRLALVEGSPLTQLPEDLYIPPDALEVILDAFEGPLDLLLYLIRRQNLDIIHINVAEITRQYMSYIELLEAMRFELAAEYLVMAAMLAEIKSRALLPRPVGTSEDDEEDPRAELIRRLLEYETVKMSAEALDELPRVDRDFQIAEAQNQISTGARLHRPLICLNWFWLLVSYLRERDYRQRIKLSGSHSRHDSA